jgi:outer membrane protein assembly factor BamB
LLRNEGIPVKIMNNHIIMHMRIFLMIAGIFLFSSGSGDGFIQWRGPNRDGKYTEKGLLKKWPEKGPPLQWSFEGLGSGHGNAGFSRDKIFILGMPDTTGILYAFSYTGKLLWKKEYGTEWYVSYKGSRSTPVVVDDLVYFTSGVGGVFCYDGNSGKKIWSVDLNQKFGAQKVDWGIAESLLVDGERLFCTPGGKRHNVVTLNRFTGETIWTSQGNHEPSAYCSPILVKHNQTQLLINITERSVIGIDAGTGHYYWRIPQYQRYKIHANTPVYSNGRIFCASEEADSVSGLIAIELSGDGTKASILWRNEEVQNVMGGIIFLDGYIYCSQYQRRKWNCINANTGKIEYVSNAFGDGAMIWADDLFYCYSERGEVALVKADSKSFEVISKFFVPLGTDQHWAHPVIYQGKLYIRHGNALMVYNIKA